MVRILVVYFSRSGNTKALAEAIAHGAQAVANCHVTLISVEDMQAKDMLAYDGVFIGSPVYYGTMAWQIKKLLDDSVAFHGKMMGKVGGAFATSANPAGGNETTVLDITNALLIHGMIVQGSASGDHYGPVSVSMPDQRAIHLGENFGRMWAELTVRLHNRPE